MDLYGALRPLLFRMDAEDVHGLAFRAIQTGLVRGSVVSDGRLKVSKAGLTFPNPLGLAAGFDKNGVALDRWASFGFGFVEVGTVTLNPQPGNPRPRLFRLPEDRALINRMGFNNEGSEALLSKLKGTKSRIPIGINLGKNKDVELRDAPAHYAELYRKLRGHGAYYVVNVSSPNTPGLRELQDRSALTDIIQAIQAEGVAVPLLVKIAPDLSAPLLDDVLRVVADCNLDGLVCTNTTLSREGLRTATNETGGLSGAPLKKLALETLKYVSNGLEKQKLLIGVGGIETADDLFERLRAGADVCQVYTGFVYGGPGFAALLLKGLLERMGHSASD